MYRSICPDSRSLIDDKNEVIIQIRQDFKVLKETVRYKSNDKLVSTEKYFNSIKIEKSQKFIGRLWANKKSWMQCKLYAKSRYKVYKYQFRERKIDVYIIKDTMPSEKYYYFVC